VIGRTYLERGQRVTVLARWAARDKVREQPPTWLHWTAPARTAPRNVLIRRPDGEQVVRPFRGLRRDPATARWHQPPLL
jgi:hypothetical protein